MFAVDWNMLQQISMQSNNNNSKKEYIDIPLNVEETPLHLYERFSQYKIPTEPVDIGFDFITKLDEAIRTNDAKNELLSLYLNYYEPINTQKFAEKDWPACFEIQAQHEDKDFNAKVQTLYNELRLRNQFEKLKTFDNARFLDVAEQAWETHESILERESREVNLPPIIAWEILENFLFELSRYHQITLGWEDKSKIDDYVFNIASTKKLLNNLISLVDKEEIKNTPSKENFAYFSIVVLATIQVYECNYKRALEIISKISLAKLSIYSRSIGSLLTLFLTASFAYFMLEQYKQSARLAEMFLVFYQKNKKYFSGIIGEKIVTRQFQKLAVLLCLNYIFLEEKPKNIIMEVFKSTTLKLKDKQHRERIADKYTKLRQNDTNTFVKLFQHCSLPSINTPHEQIQDLVLNRFKALQTITLNTILQHYTQISVEKVAKLLKISEQEVSSKIESFNKVSTGNANWDRSIMQPLLSQTRKLHVEVSEGIIKLDTDETNAHEGFNEWQQYKKEISWLAEKVNSL